MAKCRYCGQLITWKKEKYKRFKKVYKTIDGMLQKTREEREVLGWRPYNSEGLIHNCPKLIH